MTPKTIPSFESFEPNSKTPSKFPASYDDWENNGKALTSSAISRVGAKPVGKWHVFTHYDSRGGTMAFSGTRAQAFKKDASQFGLSTEEASAMIEEDYVGVFSVFATPAAANSIKPETDLELDAGLVIFPGGQWYDSPGKKLLIVTKQEATDLVESPEDITWGEDAFGFVYEPDGGA